MLSHGYIKKYELSDVIQIRHASLMCQLHLDHEGPQLHRVLKILSTARVQHFHLILSDSSHVVCVHACIMYTVCTRKGQLYSEHSQLDP